jgi:hypothetical protein
LAVLFRCVFGAALGFTSVRAVSGAGAEAALEEAERAAAADANMSLMLNSLVPCDFALALAGVAPDPLESDMQSEQGLVSQHKDGTKNEQTTCVRKS